MSRRPDGGGAVDGEARRELEPLLADLVAAGPGAAAEHPDPGRLLAYHEGRLPADDEAALQDHLAVCPACAAALLDLDAFAAAAAASGGRAPANLGTATAWRALAPRLAEEEVAASLRTATGAGAGPRATGRPARSPWLRALAASLLVAVPVLAVLLAQSRQQADALRRTLAAPQTGVPVLYLDAATRDEAIDGATLELPAGDGFFLLAVTPGGEGTTDRYRVEIADSAGRVVWRHEGVPPSDHGTVRLGFTRRALPPGRYELRLSGGRQGAPPAVYRFVLREPV